MYLFYLFWSWMRFLQINTLEIWTNWTISLQIQTLNKINWEFEYNSAIEFDIDLKGWKAYYLLFTTFFVTTPCSMPELVTPSKHMQINNSQNGCLRYNETISISESLFLVVYFKSHSRLKSKYVFIQEICIIMIIIGIGCNLGLGIAGCFWILDVLHVFIACKYSFGQKSFISQVLFIKSRSKDVEITRISTELKSLSCYFYECIHQPNADFKTVITYVLRSYVGDVNWCKLQK